VAANRAEQLMRGARPKIDSTKRKPTSLAMDEVASNVVEWGYGPPPAKETPQPEAEEQPAAEVH
ncbi:MAG TPA: DNA-directed RNA polymerase subunit omega, partial [Thermoanaerobaculia bacterium]|nr:DNA-directed RNA polymerase subunit omega [Thermoanaerobaculia bacterium]